MEKLREFVFSTLTHLYLVDYMLILLVFFLFACILLLCIFLRHKVILALFIIIFNIIICFLIYIYASKLIDEKVRARKVSLVEQKLIQSSHTLVVDFNITNTSKNNFKECKITAKIFSAKLASDNVIKKYKKNFLPFRQKSKKIKNLKKNETEFEKIAFENFNYENNYTIRLISGCF